MKKENTPLLETERLVLRKFVNTDVDDVFLIYHDEVVNRFLPWFPIKTLDEAKDFLRSNIITDYEKEVAYRYAIVYRATNQVIGYISLGSISEETESGDLGYGLLKEFWNRGMVAEAGRAVLLKLEENGFKFITATHDEANPASGKVMEKLGMTYRNSYDEMWQPKNYKVTFKLYRIDF